VRKLLYFCFLFSPLWAQTDYVIRGESLQKKNLPGGDQITITAQDIEKNQQTFTNETLAFSPSVNIHQTGGPGRQTAFFIRGARSKENRVLVDGVPMNDPISGEFDFGNFLNDDIESIAIIPGAQSLRYGSDAIGGVVSLQTFKGKGKPKASFRGEAGNHNTQHGRLRVSGEEGPWQGALTSSVYTTGDGQSTNRVHGNRQSDRFHNSTITSHMGYAIKSSWDVEGGIRYSDAHTKLDDLKFTPALNAYLPVAASNFQDTKILSTHGATTASFLKDTLTQRGLLTFSQTTRDNTATTYHTSTKGQQVEASAETELTHFAQHKSIVGEVWGLEKIHTTSHHKRHHEGLFAQHTYTPLKEFDLSGGLRVDHYQNTGSHLTWRLGASYMATDTTRLRTNVGTGFKAPLLGDLFDETPWSIPNAHLKPEKSISFDGGIDQGFWDNKIVFNITGFINHIHQAFETVPVGPKWIVQNTSKRHVRGLEGAFEAKPSTYISFRQTLTCTHSRDRGIRSPMIPTLKTTSQIHVYPTKDLDLFASLLHVGQRIDGATHRTLPSHSLLNLGGSVDVIKNVQFFGRIENITNKAYEDVFGYGTRGLTYMMGLEAKI